MIDNFIASREASRLVGVAHRTMRSYAHRHPGLAFKIANRLLIDKRVLQALLEDGQIGREGGHHG